MPRRSGAETRDLLLGTALEMLHEQGPAAGVTHIKLSDVVERADLTTGAAYRLWADQPAFHGELAVAAVRWRDHSSTEKTMAAIEPALTEGAPWQELVRRGAEANVQTVSDDLAFLTTLALRASAHRDDELVAASHERHVDAMAAYGELYGAMLATYGRRFRPGFGLEHLSAAFAALAEGFGVQAASGEAHPRLQLESDDPQVGEDWSLLGICVVALLERFTEQAPADCAEA